MITIKKIFYAVILLAVCFVNSAVLGETVKRVVPCPQDINEKEVMDKAIGEGQKMGYDLKQEEAKVVLIQSYRPPEGSPSRWTVFRITLAIAPGGDGRKAVIIDGEATRGEQAGVWDHAHSLDNDVKQIEKTVKNYLESK
jgi:hypothetical protein